MNIMGYLCMPNNIYLNINILDKYKQYQLRRVVVDGLKIVIKNIISYKRQLINFINVIIFRPNNSRFTATSCTHCGLNSNDLYS